MAVVSTSPARAALAALVVLAACKERKSAPERRLFAAGLATLPHETNVVIGFNVARLRASSLVGRFWDGVAGRDPDSARRLTELLGRCELDPGRDLQTVLLGMRDATAVALIATGALAEAKLVACVRAGGVTVEAETHAGVPVYRIVDEQRESVWLAFSQPGTLIVASSADWMAKVLDPQGPKLPARSEVMGLVQRADTAAGVWGVGLLSPEAGARLVTLTGGEVSAPPTAVTVEANLDGGVTLAIAVDMQTEADADELARFGGGQLSWLAMAAQRFGAADLVSQVKLTADGKRCRLIAAFDEAALRRLEEIVFKPEAK